MTANKDAGNASGDRRRRRWLRPSLALQILPVLLLVVVFALQREERWIHQVFMPEQQGKESSTEAIEYHKRNGTTGESAAATVSGRDSSNAEDLLERNNSSSKSMSAAGGPPQVDDQKDSANNLSMEDYSHVDYGACCGLGHRLARMSCAYYVAKQLRFELRGSWGFCGEGQQQVEIYSSLFDRPSREELAYVNSTNLYTRYGNEVGGFTDQGRRGGRCPQEDKIASDLEFYTSLRNRFKRRDDVNAFVDQHFAGKLVLGIHVRAGNGETGDFANKKRHILDAEAWARNTTNNLRNLVKSNNYGKDTAVLFMATDTPSYIERFRSNLEGVMPVVVWEQNRVSEGEGVFFGQHGAHKKAPDQTECLSRWEDTLIDQVLLSHADVVIAGKTSSFSQTMPLAIAFGRNKSERKVATPYCEVRGIHGQILECFNDYQHWACNDTNRVEGEKLIKAPMFLAPTFETFPMPEIKPDPEKKPLAQKEKASTPTSTHESKTVVVGRPEGTASSSLTETRPQNSTIVISMDDYSHVDYSACCGLGHRLARMSCAYYVAKQLRFELRGSWGFCGGGEGQERVDIYSSLFDRPSREELSYVNSTNLYARYSNEVDGFYDQDRRGGLCPQEDKIATDLEFYTSLRNRFKRRGDVNAFVKEHFAGKLVLGIHIRAGNGETGDFANKERHILDAEAWATNATNNLRKLVTNNNYGKDSAVLFMATDTPSYIERFRSNLEGVMPVIVWEQHRVSEGEGVFFGQHGAHKKAPDQTECLSRWEDTLIDQVLLSHADVVIAGKTSSFSQTMPLAIAFGRDKSERKVATPYCEVRGIHGEQLECFNDYQHWACNDTNRVEGEKLIKAPLFLHPKFQTLPMPEIKPDPEKTPLARREKASATISTLESKSVVAGRPEGTASSSLTETSPQNSTIDIGAEDYSRVDYSACCGLGHRLARMSCAYYVAKQLRFELRGSWGFCGEGPERVDLFASLFDRPSREELSYVNSTNLHVSYSNEVEGFTGQDRRGGRCPQEDKIAADLEFYTSLRNRFKRRGDVNAFVKEHFDGKLVLGIHVRAGNGETGDFAIKKRHILDAESWAMNATSNIRNLVTNNNYGKDTAILFMATDTPSYIELFRSNLEDVIPVIVWEQNRIPEGEGVFFGQHGAHKKAPDQMECLSRWEDTLIDQVLLSHADVVIAGKTSSFSQTMPLAIAFGRDKSERKVATPYCEVRGIHGDRLECFNDYQHWACNDTNFFGGEKLIKAPMFLAPNFETFPMPEIKPERQPEGTAFSSQTVTRPQISMKDVSLEEYSSVDYSACCGLGHRLARMSNAYHVAKNLGFELRGFWGWCDSGKNNERLEVYSSLFDPPSRDELEYVTSMKLRTSYGNEVAGFSPQDRRGGKCPQEDKIATDLEFYTSLRNRFKRRDQVNAFIRKHFAGKLVLGIHVRAGNGETGDFSIKKREILDAGAWGMNVTNNLRSLVASNSTNNQAVLFMATDTPSYIERFRSNLKGVMPVVAWEQERVAEGEGVFFGEAGKGKVAPNQTSCLQRWEDTLIDQVLLSHADVVIAGKESSFPQTMPLSIAFGREYSERKVVTPYCEVRGIHGEHLECFNDYLHWACNDTNLIAGVSPRKMPMFLDPGLETFPIPEIQHRSENLKSCHPSISRDRVKDYCLQHEYHIVS